jgi:cyclin B
VNGFFQVQDLIHVCDNAYSRQQILAKEKNILNRLQWNITVPTPYVFLLRFIKAAGGDKEVKKTRRRNKELDFISGVPWKL